VSEDQTSGGDVFGKGIAEPCDDLICDVISFRYDVTRKPKAAPCVDPPGRVVVRFRHVPFIRILGDQSSIVSERLTDTFTELCNDLFGSFAAAFSQGRLSQVQSVSLHSIAVRLKRVLKVFCVHDCRRPALVIALRSIRSSPLCHTK